MRTASNPSSVPGAAMILALVFAVAAAIAVSFFYRDHGHVLPTEAPASQSQPEPQPADPAMNPLDRDGRLLFLLTAQGLQLSGPRETTISEAHRVCSRFARGESKQQIVQDILSGSPGMSSDTASTFADTAISVYCPQG